MHRRSFGEEGFAITVVVLITLLALGAFVFSAAVLGVASRSGTSSERNSIQALLAADSALDTLTVRAAAVETPLPPLDDLDEGQGQFEVWIGTPGASPSNLAAYDLGGGATAVLTVLDEDDCSVLDKDEECNVTVQAEGRFGDARRLVVQTFVIDTPDPEFLRLAVPGALTSVRTFKEGGGGNAEVYGLGTDEEDWIFATRMEGSPTPRAVARLACEARAGEYIQLDSIRYRVEAVRGCGAGDVDLVNLATAAPSTIDGSRAAGLIPFALTRDYNFADFDGGAMESTIRVTDATPSLFPVGSPILVGNGVGEVNSIRTIRDPATGEESYEFTVGWTTAPGVMSEGTVIRRYVPAGVTAGSCPDSDKVFDGDCISGQTIELSNLFVKTFGASIDAVSSIADHIAAPTGNQEVVMEPNVIKWMTLGSSLNLRQLKGAGVLIIDNRAGANLTLNVRNYFEGLIYVIGDLSLQGNALSRGAIISDGDIEILNAEGEVIYDPDDGFTNVSGTMDLYYDPLALQRNVSSIEMPGTRPPSLGASVPGTWRIR